jgi:hypothetical protein
MIEIKDFAPADMWVPLAARCPADKPITGDIHVTISRRDKVCMKKWKKLLTLHWIGNRGG